MASSNVQTTYIVQDEGYCGGKPRIAGTRMAVIFIALEYEKRGWTPAEICAQHPGITLAQVHAALSHYYDHKEEMDRRQREGREFAERMEREQAERGRNFTRNRQS